LHDCCAALIHVHDNYAALVSKGQLYRSGRSVYHL
jgi:hypothetical protein